ncbi:hypothetical protein L9F63_012894, partial [Diploptera punctata]
FSGTSKDGADYKVTVLMKKCDECNYGKVLSIYCHFLLLYQNVHYLKEYIKIIQTRHTNLTIDTQTLP